MSGTLEIRWLFTPKTLFEDSLQVSVSGCSIKVSEGEVLASIPLVDAETISALRSEVESFVGLLFLGVQIADPVQYQLRRPAVSTLHADGSRGAIIECETGTARATGGKVDIRCTNDDGTTVDTRKDRVERKHALSKTAAFLASKDKPLARMLRSFRSAMADPEDELVHLYQIRDTLCAVFRSEKDALKEHWLDNKKWRLLGRLCNHEPLKEGRHRGSFGEELRHATDSELREARSLSIYLIEEYMAYLKREQQTGDGGL